jgi:hypothetical protein
VAHWRLAMPSGSGGSAATSDLGSLAATLARVLRGEVCGTEGGFIGALRGKGGKRLIRIAEISRGDCARDGVDFIEIPWKGSQVGPHVSD